MRIKFAILFLSGCDKMKRYRIKYVLKRKSYEAKNKQKSLANWLVTLTLEDCFHLVFRV